MAVKGTEMNEQDSAGNRKHRTLMTPQELEIIMRLESGKNQREIMALYSIGLSTICDVREWKDQLRHPWHQVKVWRSKKHLPVRSEDSVGTIR
jgi:hypothetical protein